VGVKVEVADGLDEEALFGVARDECGAVVAAVLPAVA
jgi:hypothetical protein